MSERQEWLAGLSVGDMVAVPGGFSRAPAAYRVERITKTQVVLSNGARYRRDTGRPVGSSGWGLRTIEPMTPKLAAEIQRRRVVGRLRDTDWGALPVETLEQVVAALDAALSADAPDTNGEQVQPV